MTRTKHILSLVIALLISCGAPTDEQLAPIRKKLDQGSYVEAISLLDVFLKANPKTANAYNLRGVAFFNTDKNSKALEDFTQAILLDSSHYQFFYNRGNVKRSLRDYKGAISDYSSAIRLDSTHYEIYLNRALANLNNADPDKAMDDFRSALALSNGQDKNIYLYRAEANLRLEQLKSAEKDFKQCLRMDEGTPKAHFGLAASLIAQDAQRNTAVACKHLMRATELGYNPAAEMMKLYCD